MDRLRKELERVHREMELMAAFDMANETHPGGFALWAQDWYKEEVLILLEMEREMDDPNSRQVGGAHYREGTEGFQHWDLVAAYGMNYFMGNMTKYVCRWRKKGGQADLEKALHYLEKFIAIKKMGRVFIPEGNNGANPTVAKDFCTRQKLSELETDIVLSSISYYSISDLLTIHTKIEKLIHTGG